MGAACHINACLEQVLIIDNGIAGSPAEVELIARVACCAGSVVIDWIIVIYGYWRSYRLTIYSGKCDHHIADSSAGRRLIQVGCRSESYISGSGASTRNTAAGSVVEGIRDVNRTVQGVGNCIRVGNYLRFCAEGSEQACHKQRSGQE